MTIQDLLDIVVKQGASDLHLSTGVAPLIRVDGDLYPVNKYPPLDGQQVGQLVKSLMSEEQWQLFEHNKELDFSFVYGKVARFRVNAYHQLGQMGAALRLIPFKIPTIEELYLPAVCHHFAKLQQGFVLVTGPTGHGKSTTLAAIINVINHTRPVHIVTIEDPIEYVHTPDKALITQREMHQDTLSWKVALKSVLREDPDVVLIGEMRSYDTIAAALTIAETGHLVFATLHTNSAAQTIDRIVDVFPPHQQAQVRMQLSATIAGVLSQRLLPMSDGGRRLAYEVLLSTPAVRNTIRDGKTHMIDNIILTSADMGMNLFEHSLADLVNNGIVSADVAMKYAVRPDELSRLIYGRKK